MTEWGVFGVLVAVVAFLISVITPLIKLTQTITKLTSLVERLKNDYETLSKKSADGRQKLWDRVEEQEKTIYDHEYRITTLENK